VSYKDWSIKYIPHKLFTIRYKKNVCSYYDLWQFFEQGLDYAAKAYLGEGKTVTPFNVSTMKEDISVWKEYKADIINYCIKDAILCYQLAKVLQTYLVFKVGLHPQSYISKATLTKEFFRKECEIPNIARIPKNVLRYGFYAYKGGRFELFNKGATENARLYDIKSAYPSVIRSLIDVTNGEWKYVKELSKDAYYGFYHCKVHIPYRNLAPLPYFRKSGLLIYPFGKWKTVLTRNEILKCLEPDQYEVINGYEFFPKDIVYPFREAIDRLYAIKSSVSNDNYLYDLCKKIMNAFYGCTYEKVPRDEGLVVGKLFNPVYAPVITADTRVQLYEDTRDIKEGVHSFATDSVLLEDGYNIDTSSAIGRWELKDTGFCVNIQTGIYSMNGEYKTRGFKIGGKVYTLDNSYDNVFQLIQDRPELSVYNFSIERPLHLRESVISKTKYDKKDINRWMRFHKSLDINKDTKRIFDTSFEGGGELWQKNSSSVPLMVR